MNQKRDNPVQDDQINRVSASSQLPWTPPWKVFSPWSPCLGNGWDELWKIMENLWKNVCREVVLLRGLCRWGTQMLLEPGDTGATQLRSKAQGSSPGWVIQEPPPTAHWRGAGVGHEFHPGSETTDATCAFHPSQGPHTLTGGTGGSCHSTSIH